MTNPKPVNVVASVKQRLLNYARRQKLDFNLVLKRYALERFLYRLSSSPYKEEFILKGAMLFYVWIRETVRATKDLDLLGVGNPSERHLKKIIIEAGKIGTYNDGLVFDRESIRIEDIREENKYPGLRIHLVALLGNSRIPLQIDIGYGDSIEPKPEEIQYPVILDMPEPKLLAYTRESTIAEKFEAMVKLGVANSRMKDYYDVYYLSNSFNFEGNILQLAMQSTFKRRGASIPKIIPSGLSDGFCKTADVQLQWKGFLKRLGLNDVTDDFYIIVSEIRKFLLPVVSEINKKGLTNTHWSYEKREWISVD